MKENTLLLLETLKTIHACRDSAALFRLIVSQSLTLVEADRGCLLVIQNNQPYYKVGLTQSGGTINEGDFPFSQTVVNKVLNSHQPLISADTAVNASLNDRVSIVRRNIRMVLCVPLIDRNEKLIGLLYVSGETPATETQLSEQRLEILVALAGQAAIALEQTQMYEKLQVLDAAKSDFIGIVSHELRTPVALLRGYTDILAQKKSLPDAERAIVVEIQASATRITEIVNLTLDATQVSQDTLRLSFQPYSLRALVCQTVERWQAAIAERHLDLMLTIPEDSMIVEVDTAYFAMAIEHLLQNAVKFTPDNGRITVKVAMNDDHDFAQITVEDTGIGVLPEHQELIFGKFYRAGDVRLHSTGKTKFMGAGPGLGLYLARGIVEAHGGLLWVESKGDGKGSEFIMTLATPHWQAPAQQPGLETDLPESPHRPLPVPQ